MAQLRAIIQSLVETYTQNYIMCHYYKVQH